MSPSNFQFLQGEWPALFASATRAEELVHPDARSACFYARRTLEMAVQWAYAYDGSLKLPYQDHLSALLHEPTFRHALGPALFAKARVIKDLGNMAVHSHRPVRPLDALMATKELFHVLFWLARTYARGQKPADGLTFDPDRLPRTAPVPPQTLEQLQRLESQLRGPDEQLAELLAGKAELDEELQRLRAEIAVAKKQNAARPDTHDYSEAETRDYFIDLLLKEAGWALDKPQNREFEVSGMPNAQGKGFVDYVLWGVDGKPLAVVEAKRTKRDPRAGQQQAKLYADCLEQQFGQRPVIYYSNGYEHWLWDDDRYPPRPVQGFHKQDELDLYIQRRKSRKLLADAAINEAIAGRYYQARAIRRITDTFEREHARKALLVMATGAGKTRTVIALCDLLMRCNWAKRVLFLADRIALVNQAVNEFKKHLPDVSPVNLVKEKETEGRVHVSTYPTMMGLIDETRDGQRRFGVGHFDLVIVDEAHRSIFQKYRAIFDYFDAALVGLTATPRDEIDRNTYRLFEIETGVPTDTYGLEEAVKDRFLVPPKAVSVPLKFQREGIKYDELSEEDKDQWDALEWSEDGDVPDRIDAGAVNKWLFNKDTVDKVLEHLMTHGLKVSGGDRLGKTIVFAKNHHHAEFIADRFNANYPHYKGEFARVIDFRVEYTQSLIDDFSDARKPPHIAISVDMLDTGIDIPEVVNLVFFKLVRSKTKFWQMLGRGTRLCPDLFGPGKDKEYFYIFDYCQNLEFFSQNLETAEGTRSEPLASKLFKARLGLICELDNAPRYASSPDTADKAADPTGQYPAAGWLRHETVEVLRTEVAAMNPNNFIVRPKRALVEKYAQPDAWDELKSGALAELSTEIAGLPAELAAEDEEAKRFDLLLLKLQLALLRGKQSFTRLAEQLKAIAGLLEEKVNIPLVQQQIALIQDIQTDDWWQNIDAATLEIVRKRLRLLVKLIEKQQRKPIYTDFEDLMEEATEFTLSGFTSPDNYERFRAKARNFLKAQEDNLVIHKLRMNKQLTVSDLAELERILVESAIGSPEDLQKAQAEDHGLGLFVRSLVGLDREAAKQAFAGFLSGKNLQANQIEFVNLIVDHLTEHGFMDAGRLYESPYTDLNPYGVDGIFNTAQVDELVSILDEIRQHAAA